MFAARQDREVSLSIESLNAFTVFGPPRRLCSLWATHNLHMRTLLAITALTLVATTASAQVYRCEHGGKVSYSDEPCVGAKMVDATPTQGMDKMTGSSRKGAEALRDERRKIMDSAFQPLTGLNHEQMNVERRRQKLSPDAKATCRNLDRQLPQLEKQAGGASASQKQGAEADLYRARRAFFELKC